MYPTLEQPHGANATPQNNAPNIPQNEPLIVARNPEVGDNPLMPESVGVRPQMMRFWLQLHPKDKARRAIRVLFAIAMFNVALIFCVRVLETADIFQVINDTLENEGRDAIDFPSATVMFAKGFPAFVFGLCMCALVPLCGIRGVNTDSKGWMKLFNCCTMCQAINACVGLLCMSLVFAVFPMWIELAPQCDAQALCLSNGEVTNSTMACISGEKSQDIIPLPKECGPVIPIFLPCEDGWHPPHPHHHPHHHHHHPFTSEHEEGMQRPHHIPSEMYGDRTNFGETSSTPGMIPVGIFEDMPDDSGPSVDFEFQDEHHDDFVSVPFSVLKKRPEMDSNTFDETIKHFIHHVLMRNPPEESLEIHKRQLAPGNDWRDHCHVNKEATFAFHTYVLAQPRLIPPISIILAMYLTVYLASMITSLFAFYHGYRLIKYFNSNHHRELQPIATGPPVVVAVAPTDAHMYPMSRIDPGSRAAPLLENQAVVSSA